MVIILYTVTVIAVYAVVTIQFVLIFPSLAKKISPRLAALIYWYIVRPPNRYASKIIRSYYRACC